jgi:hypothetical protein
MIAWNDRRSARPGMSADSKSYKVSDNVTVKSPDGKKLNSKSLKGARQARAENRDATATPSKKEARANARGLKAANEPKKVPMENVSKIATRIFGQGTTAGKPKMVVPGSKKAKRLQAKSDWSDRYEAKADAKYSAEMKKMKTQREAGK